MNRKPPLQRMAALALAATALGAQAQQIEVLHWWTAPSESKAVKVFADAYAAGGGKWLDTAIAGGVGAATQVTMSRLAAGDPPGAVQMPLGRRMRDVAAEDLLGDISDVAIKGKWAEVLPPAVLRSVTVAGKVVAVPVAMHGVNWVWYSPKVLEAAKVVPPKNWDEMLLAAEKIKATGALPFAVSTQAWQINWLWGNILAGVGGQKAYAQFTDSDPKVFTTPAGIRAFEILAKIRDYADPAAANRAWNANSTLIMNHKAAFQFMGDWAKGEFVGAGKKLGAKGDVGCMLTPGTQDFYVMMGDVIAIPRGVKPEVLAQQKKLAEIVMSRDGQLKFSLAKGSIPFRTDIKADGFDECAALAMKVMAKTEAQVPGAAMAIRTEVSGAVTDAIAKFWSTPTMTPQQGAEAAAAAMKRAL